MGTDLTYLVVPVEKGDGLVCKIGTGREVITSAASYAAVAAAAQPTDVLAVWRFEGKVSQEQAEEIALMTRPTLLIICSSSSYGTLELNPAYLKDVQVLDVKPW